MYGIESPKSSDVRRRASEVLEAGEDQKDVVKDLEVGFDASSGVLCSIQNDMEAENTLKLW